MQKRTNNQVLITEIIKQEFEENETFDKENEFFEFYGASQVLKEFDLSYEEISDGIAGASLDGGCDCLYLLINGILIKEDSNLNDLGNNINLDFYILQVKNEFSFNEDALMKWSKVSKNLFDMANSSDAFIGRYNSDVLKQFDLFKSVYIQLIRKRIKVNIKYMYISKGIDIHTNVQSQANELVLDVKALFPSANVNVSVNFISADKLMELKDVMKDKEHNLKLAENPIAIGTKKDFVTLVNLIEYYNFITNEEEELLKHIFESNVRDYQGNTEVNSEIYNSLLNKESEDFWWLNNGITILSTDAIPATGKEIIITEPEIVNGLQTSTEIYKFFSENPDRKTDEKRNILIRIIVPDNDESRDKIILATNSQTSIPKSSLRTTDIIHRQIELYLKPKGLFYDRRKNFYKNQGKKPNDIISVSFLAQCLMSIILQKPDYARARPSTLLTEEESYKKLYVSNTSLNSFLAVAIIGKETERIIKGVENMSKVEKGDILFYAIYSIAAKLIGKEVIKASDLDSFEKSQLNEQEIKTTINDIFDIYKSLGGTSKVAKGPELIKKVKIYINESLDSNQTAEQTNAKIVL